MIIETLKTKTTANWVLKLDVIDFCEGSIWLSDLYAATDEHNAGETIQVPSHLQGRNSPRFYIGQTSPAELAKSYAKQGRENPSKEAYESLQKELAHYIEASDCAVRCSVFTKEGFMLGESYSTRFDWSYDYCGRLEKRAKQVLKENGLDFVKEAIIEARNAVNSFKILPVRK